MTCWNSQGIGTKEWLGKSGLKRIGKRRWRREVATVVSRFTFAFQADYVVLGGGNAAKLKVLPPRTIRGTNKNAFVGGFRLWHADWMTTTRIVRPDSS